MQQNETPLIRDLRKYYDRDGIKILSTNFHCEHKVNCSRGCDNFTEARSAFVGDLYGEGVPRLLLVSLDPGSSQVQRDPGLDYGPAHNRTPEGVRRVLSERMARVLKDPSVATPTLFGMNRLAQRLLGEFPGFPNGESVDVSRHYAHVNAVKCCMNKKGRVQADNELFKNCRDYLRGEIDILAPDIVVTLGGKARQGFRHAFRGSAMKKGACADVRVVASEAGLRMFWLHSYHPTARFRKGEERRPFDIQMDGLDGYAKLIREFISNRDSIPR